MNSTFAFQDARRVSPVGKPLAPQPTLLCFSHLRWNFVFQRPQHLLGQAAASFRVLYVEEPEFAPADPHFRMRVAPSGVIVLTPVFDQGADHLQEQRALVHALRHGFAGDPLVLWYYTPMALRFTRDLDCDLCVYDCMDELTAFRFAPPDLAGLEAELLSRADLVFTGGPSLYAAKAGRHPHVHCFPSSVDVRHFGRARGKLADPADQAPIPRPRIGYFGVIDERMDLDLVAQAAAALRDVQFVMIGPTAKIDPHTLPRAPNLHWLGPRSYADLPAYIAHWQAAWMPFALNDATRFISPTKTPEFLAAGLPVTATAVADVVMPWGRDGLVAIADAGSLAETLRRSLSPPPPDWLRRVDARLSVMSWADTWSAMQTLMAARARVPERV
jgi:glycosyltransferase involved in cell wall biosynthesis